MVGTRISVAPYLTAIIVVISNDVVQAFSVLPVKSFSSSPTSITSVNRKCHQRLHMVGYDGSSFGQSAPRKNIELPLLDLLDNDDDDNTKSMMNQMIQPLPSSHLPDELTTLNIYGMQLTRPLHQMIVAHFAPEDDDDENPMVQAPEELVWAAAESLSSKNKQQQQFGQIAYKPKDGGPSSSSYVGAIGCAATVLLTAAPESLQGIPQDILEEQDKEFAKVSKPRTVLCRGSFRFVVKEMIQTIPYPVALVDELVDDKLLPEVEKSDNENDDDEDEDDDDDDEYAALSRTELFQRTLAGMKFYVDLQLEKAGQEMSPLEQSILEDVTGVPSSRAIASAQQQAAQEMAAVLDVFTTSMVDLFVQPQERYFAIAFLAAELANFNNNIRRELLTITDSVERMRLVLKELDEMVGMERARKLADSITAKTDEGSKELKVGTPSLPPWARQIRKGTKIEYFWNEEYEWVEGEVIEDPVLIADELIITVHFFDDDSIHKIPFRGDEKARWRPASPPSFE